jgi:hypothetical protein
MNNNLSQMWRKIEDEVRADPLKAVLLAFVGGFVFCLLPVGKLLGAAVKLAFLLLKPALLLFGVIKVLEFAGVNLECGKQ